MKILLIALGLFSFAIAIQAFMDAGWLIIFASFLVSAPSLALGFWAESLPLEKRSKPVILMLLSAFPTSFALFFLWNV